MKNDIEKTGNENLPASEHQHNYYEIYGEQAAQRNFKGQLLKFVKGRYPFGQHNEKLDVGTKVIVDMTTLSVGWLKWENDKPVDFHMGLVNEGYQPPKRPALGDWNADNPDDRHTDAWKYDPKTKTYSDCWQFNNSVVMRELGTEGDEEGIYTFVTSSRGGINAVGQLSRIYGKHIREYPELLPIVELGADTYPHSSYGDIDIPVLVPVLGWATPDEIEDATETEEETTAEDAAAKTSKPTKAKTKPTAKDEDEDETEVDEDGVVIEDENEDEDEEEDEEEETSTRKKPATKTSKASTKKTTKKVDPKAKKKTRF